jgi:outer membrane receptor protein involved in Fe transport
MLALMAAMGFAQTAQAQETPVTESVSEEIVVTVQKREQAILDVPIALTAYGSDFLDRYGVEKLDELSTLVPGLEIQDQSPNNPGFVIRGITSDSTEANQEARVAVFQDGVSISRAVGAAVELFDMERIEVAKGPQPTLFGRGALIGGINLIQNKANVSRPSVDFEIAGGDYGMFRAAGAMNIPVVEDVLGLRIAATTRQRDGFTDNALGGDALGDVDTDAARVSLRFDPTSALRVDVIVNAQRDETSGTTFKSGIFAPTGGTTSPYGFAALNRSALFDGGKELGVEREVYGATVIATYDINDALSLTSTSGWRNFESFETFDPDGFQYPIFIGGAGVKGIQWSEELRLNFEVGSRVSGFFGASYFEESGSQRAPLQFDERAVLAHFAGAITRPNPQPYAFFTNPAVLQSILIGAGVPAPAAPFVAAALKPAHQESFTNFGETKAVDVFGDVTVNVTDRLELSAGLRWTEEEKTARYRADLLNGPSVLAPLLLGAGAQGLFAQPTNGTSSRTETFDALTYRAVARYAATDNLSIWGSYARGRRPEVLVASVPVPFGPAIFSVVPAEEVDSFEVGVKTALLDGALRVEGSVFYYDYANFQTSVFNGTTFVATNAGEASATGFEGAVSWTLSDHVSMFANYGFNDAQLDSGAFKGNRFRLSPEHSFAIGAALALPLGSVGTFSIVPSYTWQSEIFFDDNNDRSNLQVPLSPALQDTLQDELQGSYGVFNLRGEFTPADKPFSIGVYVKNVTDEEYIIDAGNTGDTIGSPTFIRGAPRTVGVEFKASF